MIYDEECDDVQLIVINDVWGMSHGHDWYLDWLIDFDPVECFEDTYYLLIYCFSMYLYLTNLSEIWCLAIVKLWISFSNL